jgi:hypothetical protein
MASCKLFKHDAAQSHPTWNGNDNHDEERTLALAVPHGSGEITSNIAGVGHSFVGDRMLPCN